METNESKIGFHPSTNVETPKEIIRPTQLAGRQNLTLGRKNVQCIIQITADLFSAVETGRLVRQAVAGRKVSILPLWKFLLSASWPVVPA